MQVEATTQAQDATGADTIALGLFDDQATGDTGHAVVDALIRRGEARPKFGHVAVAHEQGRRLIVVGLGARDEFGPERARRAAAAVHRRASQLSTRTLCWVVPPPSQPAVARGLVEGTLLHAYRFDRYKPAADERPEVERLILAGTVDLAEPAREAAIVANAQNRARDLGNTPGNDLTPADLADYAVALTERHPPISVEVLDGNQIRDAGMGAFASVAQGSAQSARLIQIEYEGPGTEPGASRLALVGKGITFDSGGISLKPPTTMHEMKFDMLGGATVIEAIAALAELGAPVRVLGVVGATENMPSASAVKPGDIVRALDGTTIEVNNTDAEGRLVLADCLCYARQLGCDEIVDIATLTGAVVVALGSVYAGVMANQGDWAHRVEEAGMRSGELVWRLPLHADYAEMVKGRYAQLTNRAERREAMAITAAELLHHFVGDLPWAHIDIAGTAWDVSRPYFVGKGATGFGVRLLVELARSRAAVAA
ncbi:MAG: leucyl aminopeptidase [Solirubrobacterales bacterium]|nr:leucyl aminopeptidase [Solirubrobacterales bacterium]